MEILKKKKLNFKTKKKEIILIDQMLTKLVFFRGRFSKCMDIMDHFMVICSFIYKKCIYFSPQRWIINTRS